MLLGAAFTLVIPFLISSRDDRVQPGTGRERVTHRRDRLISVVLGTIVLLKRGAPKGFAAAGTALGGSAVFGVIVGFVQAALYSVI